MAEVFEGPVTVMFTDIEGSTGLTAELGNEAARELFRGHDEVIRRQADAHGGQEIKAFGDGFMIAFRQPSKAVQCAVEIQREVAPPLRVRIGINTGEVEHEEGDLYGEAVNAAARIADKAAGGEIWISDIVKSLLSRSPDLELKDRGRLRLKGLTNRWRLWEVSWEPAHPVLPHAERTPFIGRDEERTQLRRLLDNAAAGSGSVALIGGEPGVGKTRLATEIAEEAATRGLLAFTGRCYESEGTPSYIAFTEILEEARRTVPAETFREALGESAAEVARIVPELRRVFPDIPAPLELPPEQERHYLLNSVRDFVSRAARITPLVLVIDDLHWADEASLILLERLAENIGETPALIIGTYRDVELDIYRPLARTLDDLLRRRLATRMPLRRLGPEGVDAMLQALSGQEPPPHLAKVIYDETEGNPFFVEEVFKHLAEEGRLLDDDGKFRADLRIEDIDVPEGVRLVIGRRLQRLTEESRKILTAAAVIGKAFSYDLLAAMEEVEEDALLDAVDVAQAAGLLRPASHGPEAHFVFAHELIRQTLLGNVTLPRRQRLHLRIADAIERSHPDAVEEWSAEIGHHLFQAGTAAEIDRTIKHLTVAGDRSIRAAAFEDALRFLEEALSITPEDSQQSTELLEKVGVAHRGAGRWDEALSVWRRVLDQYEKDAETAKIGPLVWDIAQGLGWAGRWEECIELTSRGLTDLENTQDPYRARLLGLAGVINGMGGSREAAEDLMSQADELVGESSDEVTGAYRDLAEALVHFAFMEPRPVIESGMKGAKVLKESGNLWDYATVNAFVAISQMFTGDFEAAQRTIDETENLSRRLGHWGVLVQLRRVQSLLDTRTPEDLPNRYSRYLEEDREISEKAGGLQEIQHHNFAAFGHYMHGKFEEALLELDISQQTEPPGAFGGSSAAIRTYYLALLGRRDEALAIIDERWDELVEIGPHTTFAMRDMVSFAAEALYILGERARVAQLYDSLAKMREGGAVARAFDFRLHDTMLALAAASAGRRDVADAHFESAMKIADRIGLRQEKADALRLKALELMQREQAGDREASRALLEEASEVYRSCALLWREKAVQELLNDAPAER